MIKNSKVPMTMETPETDENVGSNLLLLDRAGNAARVESVGSISSVFRRNSKEPGFSPLETIPLNGRTGFSKSPEVGWAADPCCANGFSETMPPHARKSSAVQDVVASCKLTRPAGCASYLRHPGQLYTLCSFIARHSNSVCWLTQGPPAESHMFAVPAP